MTTRLPIPATIVRIAPESDDTATFTLRPHRDAPTFDCARPGQFAMLSLYGAGAAAFTLSSLPRGGGPAGDVVLTIRRVGRLTTRLFCLGPGAAVGLSGPFGHGFPDDDPGCPTIYAAGGCGLSPLKAAIDVHLAERPAGTKVAIVYGARDPSTRIHRAALAHWRTLPAVTVIETVDHGGGDWPGRLGTTAAHIAEAVAAIGARRAALCGPPAMLATTSRCLAAAGLPATGIHLAIERHMECGTGHCGHCYVNHRLVCTDGPVFTLAELRMLPDARREVGAP